MSEHTVRYEVHVDGNEHEVAVDPQTGTVTVDGEPYAVDIAPIGDDGYTLLFDRRSVDVTVEPAGDEGAFVVGAGSRTHEVRVVGERDKARHRNGGRGGAGDGRLVRASMPGIVTQILVAEGDDVEEDQALLILEAMKMENEIRARVPGNVARVHVDVGAAVTKGDALVEVEPDEGS